MVVSILLTLTTTSSSQQRTRASPTASCPGETADHTLLRMRNINQSSPRLQRPDCNTDRGEAGEGERRGGNKRCSLVVTMFLSYLVPTSKISQSYRIFRLVEKFGEKF